MSRYLQYSNEILKDGFASPVDSGKSKFVKKEINMKSWSKEQYNKEHLLSDLRLARTNLVFISIFAIFFMFISFKVSLFMLDSSVLFSSVIASGSLFLYALAPVQRAATLIDSLDLG